MNFVSLASSSKGNAYLVKCGEVAPLLIECGLSIKALREQLAFSLSGLAGCLISHSHGDHSKAVKDLIKAGVDIWTSSETADVLGIGGHYRHCSMTTGLVYGIADWKVVPFDLAHDVPTHGFLIGAPDGDELLFVPDTSYIRNRFENITILVIEANHAADILSTNIQSGALPSVVGHRVRRNHLELETVKKFILANGMEKTLREVHLIHLSAGNSDEERFRREIQELVGRPVYIAAS